MTEPPRDEDTAAELIPDPELIPGAVDKTGRSDDSANSSSEKFASLDD
ncbi:hypothetical protein BH09ACT10_BH09ACT10_02020 [soil metagenome]